MGSPSLMIVLILVVWIIVLAPLAVGNNKPIRRSGEGYEETRVLHEGGTEPMATRRRPKLTAADVHRHSEEDDYELVEVEEEPVLIDDAPALRIFPHRDTQVDGAIEGEVIEHVEGEAEAETEVAADETAADAPAASAGGSTRVIIGDAPAQAAEVESIERYDVEESYTSPADLGYAPAAQATEESAEDTTLVTETTGATGVAENHEVGEADAAEVAEVAEADEADDEDIAFAAARRGRGGYDPVREKKTTATRFQRRQRTLLGLIVACVVTFVVAFVAGGWTWVLPVVALGLTAWFMVALRRVVLQERALRQRRLRQLRRARMGVDMGEAEQARAVRYRAGTEVLALDEEHPDFDSLPKYRPADAPGPDKRDYRGDFDGGYGARAS